MSERPISNRWFALGALLPAEVRWRLFEPAYYDLVREELVERKGARGGRPFALRVVWLFVASSGLGVVLLLQDGERRRKLAGAMALMAIVATLMMVLPLPKVSVTVTVHSQSAPHQVDRGASGGITIRVRKGAASEGDHRGSPVP